ncbi:MAG: ADP-dependent glucokinase/phosphofructokinase [Candidatus Heimdallarchaeota archaeon]|nr:ADP-dependent glucokinase/phosphofructokinase [Candidatus Heimdallarchaeota archaeon]
MSKTWSELYRNSYQEVSNNLKSINGIAVGFNTNVDAIYHMRSDVIVDMINKLGIDSVALYKKVVKWKGIIEDPEDYIAGLCGCFEKGKASEWIIQNEETYNYLLENLPGERTLRMGGQVGIMANVLSELGIPKVIVHTSTLPKELKSLFVKNKNLVIPIHDKNGNITFTQPRKVKSIDDSLFLHIISEIDKGDGIKLGNIKWICPRNNRFIATFDPPNAKLDINLSFSDGINDIAKLTDVLIISGFHMLNSNELGIEGVKERIKAVLDLIQQAKQANPLLIVHLELSSTKNEMILRELFNLSRKDEYLDSLGCNEVELAEVLNVIGESNLSKSISQEPTQTKFLQGYLKICQKLSLKRLHFHQYGSYVLLTKNGYLVSNEKLKQALCYASIITAYKALTGETKKKIDLDTNFDLQRLNSRLTKSFKEIAAALDKENIIMKEEFLLKGITQYDDYNLIVIPTVNVSKPKYTVGLGDTVSSTTLAAEIALR